MKGVQNVYEHNLRPEEKQHGGWVDRPAAGGLQGMECAAKDASDHLRSQSGCRHQYGYQDVYSVNEPGQRSATGQNRT